MIATSYKVGVQCQEQDNLFFPKYRKYGKMGGFLKTNCYNYQDKFLLLCNLPGFRSDRVSTPMTPAVSGHVGLMVALFCKS